MAVQLKQSSPRHQLEKSGEPRAPATLPPKKGLPIQIGQDGPWEPERAPAENLTPTGWSSSTILVNIWLMN